MLKAVILIGGPLKGTRFRPLSFDVPKALFPVAGAPMVQHLIEACCKVPNLKEILMIGFQQADDSLTKFISTMMKEYSISIRYLQEYASLGTAGGIYHFRDLIRSGDPEAFFLINGDVCGDFPLTEMLQFWRDLGKNKLVTVLGTEATRQQSLNYGCIVGNKETHEVEHYVEKPSTFVSNIINCGVYLCSLEIFAELATIFKRKQDNSFKILTQDRIRFEINLKCNASVQAQGGVKNCCEDFTQDTVNKDAIRFEQDLMMPLAGSKRLYVYQTTRWWSQIKTAGSAIYANRHYLELYHQHHPERLAKHSEKGPTVIGDVFIHPTASVDPTAVLGPNVSISTGVTIGAGVRIRESIILGNAVIQDHALILHSIIGWNSTVGNWARVEGTPCDPNPNKPFTKMENVPLFNSQGRLNPSITILGCNVQVPAEVVVLNSIVLPHKDLGQSYKNEIIL